MTKFGRRGLSLIVKREDITNESMMTPAPSKTNFLRK